MTEPQDTTPEFGEPTDVSVDPEQVQQEAAQDDPTATSSAARYEEGDTKGGTGGLDAGGAG